ncbi:hypothetical protein AAZX31_14G178700 [Glycine max]
MGNPRAVLSLHDLVRSYHPDIIFLYETLVVHKRIGEIKSILGYDCCFTIDCFGRSVGLALIGRNPFICSLLNFSQNFINVKASQLGKPCWRFTCFYGFPERQRTKYS